MSMIQSDNFQSQAEHAMARLEGGGAQPPNPAARLAQWRRTEWHGWFRWRLCRAGRDWSKPIWIGALVLGFAALIAYGAATNRWFVTAGGVVAWFAAVNLAFFSYFGLTLPGPPRENPGPFKAGLKIRATIGLYPADYDRRKLARIWVRAADESGGNWLFELPFPALPDELQRLQKQQEHWRIQRGDAPATEAVIETLAATRVEIDAGVHPVRVIAWRWDEQALTPFDRTKIE